MLNKSTDTNVKQKVQTQYRQTYLLLVWKT